MYFIGAPQPAGPQPRDGLRRALRSHHETEPAPAAPREDPAVESPRSARAREEEDDHGGYQEGVEALLAEAHPLAREAIVQAEEEPDERGEAGEQSENEPETDRRLAESLKRRERAAIRQHRALEKLLVPVDGVPGGELGDALGMEGEEARGHRGIGNHVPKVREGELGPHGLYEPRADDD